MKPHVLKQRLNDIQQEIDLLQEKRGESYQLKPHVLKQNLIDIQQEVDLLQEIKEKSNQLIIINQAERTIAKLEIKKELLINENLP